MSEEERLTGVSKRPVGEDLLHRRRVGQTGHVSGDHPGFIADDVSGQVFGPDFQMVVAADSNLRIMDDAFEYLLPTHSLIGMLL